MITFRLFLLLTLSACASTRHELALPDVRQATDHTCSASALQAILAYYGEVVREDLLARELKVDPKEGAPPEAIADVARAHGLSVERREQVSIADLAQAISDGVPVLIAIQAREGGPPPPLTSYRDDWEDGHYVVVVAVDGDHVIFEDPQLLGSRGVLTRAALEERWHDRDGDRRNDHLGLFFRGKPPRPAPTRRTID